MAKSSKVYIGEYSEDHLLKLAKKMVDEKSAKTRIFDQHAEASVPQLAKSGERDKRLLLVNHVTKDLPLHLTCHV